MDWVCTLYLCFVPFPSTTALVFLPLSHIAMIILRAVRDFERYSPPQ